MENQLDDAGQQLEFLGELQQSIGTSAVCNLTIYHSFVFYYWCVYAVSIQISVNVCLLIKKNK